MVLPEPKSFIEDESRRRLFWMVYLLDRYATVATAFEFALDEKEIDRKLVSVSFAESDHYYHLCYRRCLLPSSILHSHFLTLRAALPG